MVSRIPPAGFDIVGVDIEHTQAARRKMRF
jgi:hypothetical protein